MPKRTITATYEVEVVIEIAENAPDDVISRCFTDDWRNTFYTMRNDREVIGMLAYNGAVNGVEDLSRLDGWGDLERGMVTMSADGIDINDYEEAAS